MYSLLQKNIILFALMMLTSTLETMEHSSHKKKTRTMKTLEEGGKGTIAGTLEVLIDNPLIYAKNRLQLGDSLMTILKNYHKWWSGAGVGCASMAPTTAIQLGSYELASSMFPDEKFPTLKKYISLVLAAACSAPVCGPTELLIIHKQNKQNSSVVKIFKLLYARGIQSLFTASIPTCFREIGFMGGYKMLAPRFKESLNEYISNDIALNTSSGTLAGILAAITTHPFDTIKTRMQANVFNENPPTIRSTMRSIIEKDGYSGFLRGLSARGARVILAITLMSTANEKLTALLNK